MWNSNILDTPNVDIELWNYQEVSQGVPTFERVHVIAQAVANSGSFTFNTVQGLPQLTAAVIRVIERPEDNEDPRQVLEYSETFIRIR